MASTRLTKTMREDIVNSIVTATFKQTLTTLQLRANQAADAAYLDVIPAAFLEMVKDNPATWFKHMTNFYINESNSKHMQFIRAGVLPLTDAKPIPNDFNAYCAINKFSPNIQQMLTNLSMDTCKYSDSREHMRIALNSTLLQFTTVEKLRLAIPELITYLPDTASKMQLPAVQTDDLITSLKQFGLPIPKP